MGSGEELNDLKRSAAFLWPRWLLEPAKTTNFIYAVEGVSSFVYVGVEGPVFKENLFLVDSCMDRILGLMVLECYKTGLVGCRELVERLEAANPLGFPRAGFYAYKVRKFFSALAFGMVPDVAWDGRERAVSRFRVKNGGDVFSTRAYHRDVFEEGLLENTCLASPAVRRYASNNGRAYLQLNLSIRFK